MVEQRQAAVALYLADNAQVQADALVPAEPTADVVVSDDSDDVEVLSNVSEDAPPASPEGPAVDGAKEISASAISNVDLLAAGPSGATQPPPKKPRLMEAGTDGGDPAQLAAPGCGQSDVPPSETASQLGISSPYLVLADPNHDVGSIAELSTHTQSSEDGYQDLGDQPESPARVQSSRICWAPGPTSSRPATSSLAGPSSGTRVRPMSQLTGVREVDAATARHASNAYVVGTLHSEPSGIPDSALARSSTAGFLHRNISLQPGTTRILSSFRNNNPQVPIRSCFVSLKTLQARGLDRVTSSIRSELSPPPSPPVPYEASMDVNPVPAIEAALRASANYAGRVFFNNSDVTVAMASSVFSTSWHPSVTTPEASELGPYLWHWHSTCLKYIEAEIWDRITSNTAVDPVTFVDLAFVQDTWWASDPSDGVRMLIHCRYKTAYHPKDLDPFVRAKFSLDPLFAGWFAVNWRYGTLRRLKRGLPLSDIEFEKLSVPLDALVLWITFEMVHNNLLMADVARATLGAGMLVSTNVVLPEENLPNLGSYLSVFNPEQHAMFAGRMVGNKWTHFPVEQQRLWVVYRPQPGLQGGAQVGYGRGYRTAVELHSPRWTPELNHWNIHQFVESPPPANLLTPSCSDHDLFSLKVYAQPTVLYEPSPAHNLANINAPCVAVTKPGFGDSAKGWPASLSDPRLLEVPIGTKAYDVDDSKIVLSLGPEGELADGWIFVAHRPPGLPMVDMLLANLQDEAAFEMGCSQGCGNEGHIRYLTEDDEHNPLYSCFFCNVAPMAEAEMHLHLDICQEGKIIRFSFVV